MPTLSKKSFCVLTVSKRRGWMKQASESVEHQTVIVPRGHWKIIQEGLNSPKKTRVSNLNASLNRGLKDIIKMEKVNGKSKPPIDYVIFYQDFIDLPKDCFEKLLELVDDHSFITTATINSDGTNDSRYLGADLPRAIRPEEWEANVAIAPMKVIRELGGFWEELDNGWSWDNVDLAQRAAMVGCKFIIDESNSPQLLEHEQTSKLNLELNGQRCANHIAAIRAGKSPLNVGCL